MTAAKFMQLQKELKVSTSAINLYHANSIDTAHRKQRPQWKKQKLRRSRSNESMLTTTHALAKLLVPVPATHSSSLTMMEVFVKVPLLLCQPWKSLCSTERLQAREATGISHWNGIPRDSLTANDRVQEDFE